MLWHRYDNDLQRGDIAQDQASTQSGRGNLTTDQGLISAAQLSLFTNQRAPDGFPVPGEPNDRQGWWGDRFFASDFDLPNYQIGSLIWTLRRSKNRQQTLNLLRDFAIEAVGWMAQLGVIDRAEAQTSRVRQDTACVQLALYRPGDVSPLWTPAWEVTIGGL